MRTTAVEDMVKRSQGEGLFNQMVRAATEVGVVIPSILKKQLVDAGHIIETETKRVGQTHGVWAIVMKDSQVVARAFSHDEGDAILQAIYAEMKAGR